MRRFVLPGPVRSLKTCRKRRLSGARACAPWRITLLRNALFGLLVGLVIGGPLATPLAAEDFTPMSGPEIAEALTGITLDYEGAWQDFRASGRTLYNAGRDSWGYWRVQGDLYCSQWPPRQEWACYAMARSGETLRFIGSGDDVTDGIIRK